MGNRWEISGAEESGAGAAVGEMDGRFLVTATKKGQIKKTALKAYANPRRGGIRAVGVGEGD